MGLSWNQTYMKTSYSEYFIWHLIKCIEISNDTWYFYDDINCNYQLKKIIIITLLYIIKLKHII